MSSTKHGTESSAHPGRSSSANHAAVRDSRRDDDDAATVIAILFALTTAVGAEDEPATRSVWADPARRFGLSSTSATGWWASGLPR